MRAKINKYLDIILNEQHFFINPGNSWIMLISCVITLLYITFAKKQWKKNK